MSTEWLCFVDRITQYTQHKQDYSLMKYVPFLPVAFHMMYASFVPPRISFPHIQFEVSEDLGLITGCMQWLVIIDLMCAHFSRLQAVSFPYVQLEVSEDLCLPAGCTWWLLVIELMWVSRGLMCVGFHSSDFQAVSFPQVQFEVSVDLCLIVGCMRWLMIIDLMCASVQRLGVCKFAEAWCV